MPPSASMHLRVYRPPSHPHTGHLVRVPTATVHPSADGRGTLGVSGVGLYATLTPLIDISQETPYIYSGDAGRFEPVRAAPGHFYEAGEAGVLDIRLAPATGAQAMAAQPPAPPIGFAKALEMTSAPPPPPPPPPPHGHDSYSPPMSPEMHAEPEPEMEPELEPEPQTAPEARRPRSHRPRSQPAPPDMEAGTSHRRAVRGICGPLSSPAGAWCGIGLALADATDVASVSSAAAQLGASYVFTVGPPRSSSPSSSPPSATPSVPCFAYDSAASFLAATPADAAVVAIVRPGTRRRGVPLGDFPHPKRAVYILAPEDDHALADSLLAHARLAVAIPAAVGRPAAIGDGAAAAVVLWDRAFKHMAVASLKSSRRKRQSAPSREAAVREESDSTAS